MVNISSDLKAILKSKSAKAFVKIECGDYVFGYNADTAVNDNKILELQISRAAAYDDFPLGNAYSCYANITLWDIPSDMVLKGQKTSVSVGYIVNDEIEWISLGVYYPEKPSRSGQCLSFTAYDKMYGLSFPYVPLISGEQTPIVVLEDLARAGGFELDESVYSVAAGDWDSISMSLLYSKGNDENGELTSLSVSDCISYVAGYVGANAVFGRNGKLSLHRFADAVDENNSKYVIDDDCVNDVSVDESDSRIEYITCNNGIEEITSSLPQHSDSAKGIRFSNPLITKQSQLDKVRSTVLANGAFSYRVISLMHLCGNPAWDCFDVISYEDADGNGYNFPLMSIEIIYDGAIVCNLHSFSKSIEEQNFPTLENSLKGKLRDAQVKIDRQNAAIALKVSKDNLASEISQTPDTIYLSSGNGTGKVVIEGDNFGVDESGKMHCKDAEVSGKITATSGKIGLFDITHEDYPCLWYESKKYAMQMGNYGGETNISGYEVLSPGAYGELWRIGILGDALFRSVTSDYFQCNGYTNRAGVCYDTLLISGSGSYIISEPDSTSGVYFGTGSNASAVKDTYIRGGNVRLYNVESGGGVYLGTSGSMAVTSDENLKHLYSLDEKYEAFFKKLQPLLYTYKQRGHRKHIGYGARQVKEALSSADLTTEEFAGVVVQKNVTIYADENGTGEDITYDELYSLRYEEFVALNTYMIQKLLSRIDSLERKVKALEGILNDNA